MGHLYEGFGLIDFLLFISGNIFNLLPLLAYYFIHRHFKSLWTLLMFYPILLATILDYIKEYFMQGYSASYSKTGELISQIEPSNMYMYVSYASGILQSIAVVGLLLFAINLNKK